MVAEGGPREGKEEGKGEVERASEKGERSRVIEAVDAGGDQRRMMESNPRQPPAAKNHSPFIGEPGLENSQTTTQNICLAKQAKNAHKLKTAISGPKTVVRGTRNFRGRSGCHYVPGNNALADTLRERASDWAIVD